MLVEKLIVCRIKWYRANSCMIKVAGDEGVKWMGEMSLSTVSTFYTIYIACKLQGLLNNNKYVNI